MPQGGRLRSSGVMSPDADEVGRMVGEIEDRFGRLRRPGQQRGVADRTQKSIRDDR